MATTNTKAAVQIGAGLFAVLLLVLFSMQYRNSQAAAREATLKAGLFQMRDAIDEHLARTGKCPESLKVLAGRHLPRIPVDPITESTTTWQFIKASDRPGGCDVKSGSPLTARDGSRYADW